MSVLNEHFNLPVKEVVQKVVTATTTSTVLAPGVYKGGIRVVGDANLTAPNIKKDVQIFGVTGSAVAGTPVTPTGPGPTSLIAGNLFAGYYGKATGIITGNDLCDASYMNLSNGTAQVTGDITWLKFASNNRTLFIADRAVRYSISWDNIQAVNGVKGKVITISGVEYLCRIPTGSEHYFTGSLPTTNTSYAGGEWELIVNFTPLDSDSHWNYLNWNGGYTWCQEVHSNGLTSRVIRGGDPVSYFSGHTSSFVYAYTGWRPVLEVL